MSNNGYRSIEINVSNYLNATSTVQGCTAAESFIDGEEATVGQGIPRDQTVVWGVKTNESRSEARMQVDLGGLGGLTITAINDADGKSSVQFSNVSPDISPTQQRADGSTMMHSHFDVQLNPT